MFPFPGEHWVPVPVGWTLLCGGEQKRQVKLCLLGIFPGQSRNVFVQKQLDLAGLAGGLANSLCLRSGAAVV